MNKKYRHHPMFLLDNAKSSLFIAVVIGFYIYSEFNLLAAIAAVIAVILLSLGISAFLYLKSYYEITDDRVVILRKTIFSYNKKEVYFDNLSTFDVTNYFYYKFFDVNKVTLDTASVVTAKKDDLVIYISDERLEELQNYYDTFKNNIIIDAEEESEDKTIDSSLKEVRKYNFFDTILHVFFSQIDNLLVFLLILIVIMGIVIYFKLYWIIVASLFTVILYLIQYVYGLIKKAFDIYNFTVRSDDSSVLISKGLIKTTNIRFDFKNIKGVEIVKNRVIKRTYVNIDVIGLSNYKSKDDSLVTLFDKASFIKQVTDSIEFDNEEFKLINKNYKALILNTVIYLIILVICSYLIYFIIDTFYPYYAISITTLVFAIFLLNIILKVVSYTVLTKFYANDREIKYVSGFLNQKQIIFKRENLQKITVSNNLLNKLFKTSNIIFSSYKIDSSIKNIILFTHINQKDISYLINYKDK